MSLFVEQELFDWPHSEQSQKDRSDQEGLLRAVGARAWVYVFEQMGWCEQSCTSEGQQRFEKGAAGNGDKP